MAHRLEKFASTLQQALADILLTELDNPVLKTISVSRVHVSADLRQARVQVSTFASTTEQMLAELERAQSPIKRLLAKKMYLRYIPDLVFVPDDAFALDQRLSRPACEGNDEKKDRR